MSTFEKMWNLGKRIAHFEAILRLIEWDQETYMPKGAAASRADQIELLASTIHKEKTDPKFVEGIEKLDLNKLEAWQKAAVREWKEDIRKAKALPNDFVKAFAKLTSESMIVWQEARKEANFKKFAPMLKKVVALSREKAEFLGYEDSPYDALMDLYEPGMKVKEIDPLFKDLGSALSKLLEKIPPADNRCLNQKVAVDKQIAFGNKLLKAIGYEMDHGRLDISTHPFSTAMHPTDSRITTRITEHSYFDSISAVMHEAGHGLYEMQLNPDYFGTPIGEACSLGIHESQSRTWETFIGQSRPFWQHFFPLLHKSYKLEKTDFDTFYAAINCVKPTFIRVEADEVTYCLHVILRYQIEKDLIEGKMEVSDIPERWNSFMEKLLGIIPPTDKEGCLQDIHWSMGAIGYFPTYALGTVYAAQFFEAFAKDFPDWEKRVSHGELLFIRDWQKEKIHRFGRTFSSADLVKKVTGQKLSTTPYLNYLERKYATSLV